MKIFTLLCLGYLFTTIQISKAQDDPPPATTAYGFERENHNIRQDAVNIKNDKDRIAYWRFRVEREHELNRTMAANMAVKELAKARSDLKRDIAYLKADEKNLRKNHQVVIKQTRVQLKDNQATIKSLDRKIRQANKHKDFESAQYYAVLLDIRKKNLTDNVLLLENLILWQKDNLNQLKDLEVDTDDYVGYSDTYKPDKAIAAF